MPEFDHDATQPTRIEAAAFEIGVGAQPVRQPNTRLRLLLLIVATGLLACTVLLVIFALPKWIDTPPESAAVGPGLPTPASIDSVAQAPAPAEESASPEAREDTQTKLRETLDKLAMLEAMGAEKWAKSQLFGIRQRIADGEKAYREKRYVNAQNIYIETAASAAQLLSEVPKLVAELVDAGNLALEKGDSAKASAAFEQALMMDSGNAAATRGQQRATTLDQVLALVGQAEGYQRLKQNDKAMAAYREALALDPDAPGALAATRDIERGQRENAIRRAMSAGLKALEKNRFSEARKAFSRAAKLDPTRRAVKDALQQVANAESSYHIARHLAAASSAAKAEVWDEAFKKFSAALKYDERLSEALAGKRNAALRHQIDQHLNGFLAKPARLSDSKVQVEATELIARARALGSRSPRLTQQIAELEGALTVARTPVTVQLVSDNFTVVALSRVGELGQFSARELELLPGNYVALGKRDGYRDVRVEFNLTPSNAGTPITVQCQEKFAFGN
jgi:tetratricopeptide (TPR) repeat protein